MGTNKTFRYLLIAAVVLIILALVGKKAGWFGKSYSFKVAVEKPEKRTIIETITANGKIQPETEVKISPDVSGEIVELNVEEGQYVKEGKLLLRIKPDTYISIRDRAAAAVNSAKANLANAQARLSQVKAQFTQTKLSYERNQKLWKQRTISESEWEAAQSQYEMAKADVTAAEQSVKSAEYSVKSAEASLKEAQENLTKTSIYAPMSGTVAQLNVEKGERVVGTEMMSGTDIMQIADLSRMEVKVEVNENDIVRVNMHDTAVVEVDAYLDQDFRGVVTEIANSANVSGTSADQVTNFDVTILLLKDSYQQLITDKNPNPFRPGMSATVDIQTNRKNNVLSIPIQAVTTRNDSVLMAGRKKDSAETAASTGIVNELDELHEVVFVVSGDTAKLKEVKTGIQDNNYIEILSGVEPEDKVVTAPYSAISRRLKDGALVEITSKNKLFKED
ncbi:MAG TPA: efflux RND transporter periplasmic adaptor subunit [Bacteroidales bacterium]|nr:efflux RND transporter periplasmic adaptor subunit [Bacteroidales bacterium]